MAAGSQGSPAKEDVVEGSQAEVEGEDGQPVDKTIASLAKTMDKGKPSQEQLGHLARIPGWATMSKEE